MKKVTTLEELVAENEVVLSPTKQYEEELGVGIGMGFVLPVLIAIGVQVWAGVWYISLAVFFGCLIGAYEFGREEIAKKANQTIIKQASL